MKVSNLSNIVEALKTVSVDNSVTLVIDSLKKRAKSAIGYAIKLNNHKLEKVGDIFFQLHLDEVAPGVKTGSSIQISLETGDAVLLDIAPVKVSSAVQPAKQPGRSSSGVLRNSDMLS